MKSNTSPPFSQPKQYQDCFCSLTEKLGVFSGWKGHSPTKRSAPAFLSWRWPETTFTMSARSRTASTSSCLILPATAASPFGPSLYSYSNQPWGRKSRS